MRTIHTSVPGRMDVRMVHMILDSTPFYKIAHVETEKTTPKTHSYTIESAAVRQYPGWFLCLSQRRKQAKITPNHNSKTEGGVQCPACHKRGNGSYPCF